MSDKQKELLERIADIMSTLDDRQLENLLCVGEGMAIMSALKKNAKN